MEDPVFKKRFIRAWLTSRTLPQVARRMGGGMTPAEARRVARALLVLGVRIPPEPAGLALRDRPTLTRRADGNYENRRGREAYRVGPGTALEGPWACPRCGEVRLAGFFVLPEGDTDAWFICGGCVRVVE